MNGENEKIEITRRTWRVWQRNKDVFMKTYKTNFIPAIIEPVIYLAAFGFGLGVFIENIDGISYAQFLAPAIIAIAIMNSAFFECTYGSFVRMHYQKTFEAIVATPLNIDEVIAGEMLWGATKSLIDASIILAVITLFGLIGSVQALVVVPFAFFGGLMFASLAMFFTSLVPNIDSFNFPFFLFVTPMTFFSGTFFPISILPGALQTFALFLPLTPVTQIVRDATLGTLGADAALLLFDLALIAIIALFFFFLSIRLMKRRLIE